MVGDQSRVSPSTNAQNAEACPSPNRVRGAADGDAKLKRLFYAIANLADPVLNDRIGKPKAIGARGATLARRRAATVHHSKIGGSMSALGQKQTLCIAWPMSSFLPIADVG
jgi:hypothetical protein